MESEKSERRLVFITGVSRSGTTLMKRILNTYPDVIVWGEHHTFIRQLSESFYRVYESPYMFQDGRPWQKRIRIDEREQHLHGWINPFDRVAWIRHFRDLLDAIFVPPAAAGYRFVGFKDPGYADQPNDRSIEFIRLLYPTAIFVFMVRDGFNRIASARVSQIHTNGRSWILTDGKRACDRWVNQNRRLLEWHQSGKLRSYWVRYEDLIRGRGEVHRLLHEMHLEWGKAQAEVVNRQPGWISSFRDSAYENGYNERWKTLSLMWRCYVYARIARFSRKLGYAPPAMPLLQQGLGWALLALGQLMDIVMVGRLRQLIKRALRISISSNRTRQS